MVRLIVVAVIVGLAPTARADELDEARRLRGELEFDAALGEIERVLARGDAGPDLVAAAYRLAGELAAGLHREADAEEHFVRLLALRPDAALPAGVSPKVAAPFERARARIGASGPLAVRAEAAPGGVDVIVERDPAGLVAGARARWAGAEARAAGAARLHVAIPAGARDVEVAAIDRHGNAVWIGAAPAPVPDVVAPPPERPPVWARWEVWAAPAVLGGVIAGVEAWRLGDAQDEWDRLRAEDGQHDYSELADVEARGRRHAFAANVSLGIAAVAGTASMVLLVRELRAGDAPRVAPTVVVTPGAAGLGFAGRF